MKKYKYKYSGGGWLDDAITGLGAGAAVGSAIPVIGTAIGAAVGFVGGAIGGAIGDENAERRKEEQDKKRRLSYESNILPNRNPFAPTYLAKEGGTIPIEAEKQEVMVEPDGNITMYDGASHQNGGIQDNAKPGGFIYTDDKSIRYPNQKETFAQLARKKARHVANIQKKVDKNPNRENINTLNIEKERLAIGLQELAYAQEALKEDQKQKEVMKKGGWIKKAVNPAHKGYCTPMTKSTCTPHRKALARTFKKHHGFHKKQEGGYVDETTPESLNYTFQKRLFKKGGCAYCRGGKVMQGGGGVNPWEKEQNEYTLPTAYDSYIEPYGYDMNYYGLIPNAPGANSSNGGYPIIEDEFDGESLYQNALEQKTKRDLSVKKNSGIDYSQLPEKIDEVEYWPVSNYAGQKENQEYFDKSDGLFSGEKPNEKKSTTNTGDVVTNIISGIPMIYNTIKSFDQSDIIDETKYHLTKKYSPQYRSHVSGLNKIRSFVNKRETNPYQQSYRSNQLMTMTGDYMNQIEDYNKQEYTKAQLSDIEAEKYNKGIDFQSKIYDEQALAKKRDYGAKAVEQASQLAQYMQRSKNLRSADEKKWGLLGNMFNDLELKTLSDGTSKWVYKGTDVEVPQTELSNRYKLYQENYG